MTLPADYSRCTGDAEQWACQTCERRLQIEKDDPNRWYPMVSHAPISGRCEMRIAAKEQP